MHATLFQCRRGRVPLAAILTALAAATVAWPRQGAMPPSPVRYTEAQEYPVRRTVTLPGSVESRTVSVVASEVEGKVMELFAREGDTVRRGEPLARLRTTNLELQLQSAEAQLKEADSRLNLAQLSLNRAQDLLRSNVASQQEYDNARYEQAAWEGRVGSLQADISRIKLAIELCTIRAPFGGLIVTERTEVGEWSPTGGAIVEMLSLDDLEVRVEVPERYFASLNPGAKAQVRFESIPGLDVEGKVTAIVPRADPQARTFPLKVRVPNKEGRIGVGMLAQVSFPAGESYRATVVPKDAVVTQGDDRFVYLIGGDDKVSAVPVRTGEGVGSWIVVEGDVRAGQKVVTRGNERLRPGLVVTGEAVEYALP